MTKYRCPTLGDCERANSGEIFERSPGDDLKCPGCGTLLEQVGGEAGAPAGGAGGPAGKLMGIAALALAVVGGGVWFMKRPVAGTPTVVADAASAPSSAVLAGMTGPGGMAPSEADLARQKQESQTGLVNGQASSAEASSTQAASNEMVKAGIARLAQGKLDEAEKSFRSAIEIDPKQSLGYYNMAILRLRQGRADDALKEFEACFMAGFSHYDKLEQDTDLDTIRQDKRFVELVARYRGR